jgi:TatD DNase family protein
MTTHSPVGLVDTHCHLQEEVLEGHVEAIVSRARETGVSHLVVNGTHPGDWPQVLDLARTYPEVVPCFGLHPWFVGDAPGNWAEVLEHYIDAVPSAVGEIGLDRWVKDRDEVAQEEALRIQLAIAYRRHLPVMVHCLRAWGWLMGVLQEVGPSPAGMLIHAYGGPAELIGPLCDLGGYFSFAGNVLDDRRKRARASLLAVPLDRLLVETDAPAMLPPEPFGPHVIVGPDGEQWNEPANLPSIAVGIAQLLRVSPEALADATRENARNLFGDLLCRTNAS